MSIGDIYWIDLPGGAGHAQAGRRPAIVFQGVIASTQLPTTLIVPLTTRLEALRFPGTALIESDTDNGLRRNSVALVFQISVIDKRFLDTYIGHISEETVQAIRSALDDITERKPVQSSETVAGTDIQI